VKRRLDWRRVLKIVKPVAVCCTPIGHYALLVNPLYPLLIVPALLPASPYLAAVALATACAALGLAPLMEDPSTVRLLLVAVPLLAALPLARRRAVAADIPDDARLHHWRVGVARFLRPILLWAAGVAAATLLLRPVPVIEAVCWAGLYFLVGRALPKPPKRDWTWRGALGSAALFAVALAVSAALFETGARLLFGAPVPLADQAHPDRVRTLRPNSVGKYRFVTGRRTFEWRGFRVSSLGLRDREYGRKANDEYRILMLGDSFTFGYGLEPDQTISWCLQERLREQHWPKRMVVINGGVGGYTPGQSLSLLRELAPRLQPNLVILQLLLSNDIAETLTLARKHLKAHNETATQARMLMTFHQGPLLRAHQWLYSYSAAYRAFWLAEVPPYELIRALRHLRFYNAENLPRVEPSEDRPSSLEPSLIHWYPELAQGAAMLAADIREMHVFCLENDIDLVGFAVPAAQAVSPYWWKDTLGEKAEFYECGKDAAIGEEMLAESGIPYVPIMTPMCECAYVEFLYFPYDMHFTPLGADLVADELAKYLRYVAFPEKIAQ